MEPAHPAALAATRLPADHTLAPLACLAPPPVPPVGNGKVLFGADAIRAFPEWWGAVGNGVADDAAAVQVGGQLRCCVACCCEGMLSCPVARCQSTCCRWLVAAVLAPASPALPLALAPTLCPTSFVRPKPGGVQRGRQHRQRHALPDQQLWGGAGAGVYKSRHRGGGAQRALHVRSAERAGAAGGGVAGRQVGPACAAVAVLPSIWLAARPPPVPITAHECWRPPPSPPPPPPPPRCAAVKGNARGLTFTAGGFAFKNILPHFSGFSDFCLRLHGSDLASMQLQTLANCGDAIRLEATAEATAGKDYNSVLDNTLWFDTITNSRNGGCACAPVLHAWADGWLAVAERQKQAAGRPVGPGAWHAAWAGGGAVGRCLWLTKQDVCVGGWGGGGGLPCFLSSQSSQV